MLPRSAGEYLQELEDKCAELGVGEIATISGRYYAMDRDKRWDRVEKAYRAVALGQGHEEPDAQTCLKNSYASDVSDEFVVPTIIHKHPVADATAWCSSTSAPTGPPAYDGFCLRRFRRL